MYYIFLFLHKNMLWELIRSVLVRDFNQYAHNNFVEKW